MTVTESEIEIPYFREYYPSVGMLDRDQLHFFKYWVQQLEKGTPRTADTSYIFIYVYHLFDQYWGSPNQKDESIRKLTLIHDLYEDQVGMHVALWLSDLYFAESKYDEAFRLREKHKDMLRVDSHSLNLKLLTNQQISSEDVLGVAKRFGLYPTALQKRRIDEVNQIIKTLIDEDSGGDLLKELSVSPLLVETKEYLFAGLSGGHKTVVLIDFFSHSSLIDRCITWTQKAFDSVQEKYGRKNNSRKPSKKKLSIERSLWDIKVRDAFENPDYIESAGKECSHKYLRLRNHWETYRKYDCNHCDRVFMCDCDKDIALKMRPYQTEGQWLSGICPRCRGLDDTSIVTEGKLIYGSTFKAIHWREIMIEADWLAYRENDELDFNKAENNIREKYGVPLIGEGWISETTMFKNLQEIFPDLEVIHHGRPDWLGRMHLDVYIPEIKVAFEYQGKQHSQPVEYFGGQDAFEQGQKRDEQKAALCLENGVELFYIHEGEDFSVSSLKRILFNYL